MNTNESQRMLRRIIKAAVPMENPFEMSSRAAADAAIRWADDRRRARATACVVEIAYHDRGHSAGEASDTARGGWHRFEHVPFTLFAESPFHHVDVRRVGEP